MSFIAQIYEALMPTVVPDPAPCGDHKPTPNYSFDPASYPHLFDGIIATADIDTLAALRNTCRTLRGRISSLLEHVVIRRALPTTA
jgi:hypothetical protein